MEKKSSAIQWTKTVHQEEEAESTICNFSACFQQFKYEQTIHLAIYFFTVQCIGVDLNRNFDFHHAGVGASKEPCNTMYAGPKSFSEPETFALSEFVKTFHNIKLYLAFHSYSQLILFPYVSNQSTIKLIT